jgi:GNAT superfamily N-acetyltransferase
MSKKIAVRVYPVTVDRWRDLEKLFGEHGAYGGCWCMYFRLRSAEFARRTARENKRDMKKLVRSNDVPGLLAYAAREPIAWVSIAPREEFAHLKHSRILTRVDDQPVWSVVCFFVTKPYRGKGVMPLLLQAAVKYAAKGGAKIVEGYPSEVGSGKLTGYDGFTGVVSAFHQAGFIKVKQISQRQSVMRYTIEKRRAG